MSQLLDIVNLVGVCFFPVPCEKTRNVFIASSLGYKGLQVGILKPSAFLYRHFGSNEPNIPVILASDQCNLKLHSIGSQRAGLIGEDILNLS